MSMAYSSATDTQRVIERILGTSAGSGTIIMLAGPGTTEVLDKVARSVPGFAVTRVHAMPWRENSSFWVSNTLKEELGDFASLDTTHSAHAVIVENAQWADTASVRELIELARGFRKGRLALILATASSPAIERYRYLADLSITLPPLGVDDVAAISLKYRGVHLTPDVSNRVLEVTGGNVELIRDILDAAPEEHWRSAHPYLPLPVHWRSAFEERTKDIEVTEALQVISACSDLDALPDLIADPTQLTTAFSAGLVHSVPDGSRRVVVFSHSTDLGVVRASSAPGVISDVHQRAAQWYRARGEETQALIHDAHGLEGRSDELADTLIQRARQLSSAGNYRQAFILFSLASKVAEDPLLSANTNLMAIEALIADSDIPRARQYTLQLRNYGANANVDVIRGYLALHEGHRTDGKNLIERAWTTLEAHNVEDPELRTRVASRHVLLSLCEWQPEKLLGWAHTSRTWAAPDSPAHLEAHYISMIGKAATTGKQPEDGPMPWETDLMAQRRHMASGWIALVHDDAATARQHLLVESSGEGSERIGSWMDAWLARTHLLLGDLVEADRAVERGLARAERFGIRFLEPLLLWTACTVSSMRGDSEITRMYTNRLTTSHDSFPIQQIPSAMARLHIASFSRDETSALRYGEFLADLDRRVDISQPGFWPWHDLWVSTLVQAGRLDDAENVLDTNLDRHRGSSIVSVLGKLRMSQGRLAIARGDSEEGIRLYDEALEMIEPLNLPFYTSRVLFEYGQALRRLGKRKLADDRFARASELYSSMGADYFVERCNRERRAGGLGVRGAAEGGLTPQELEIATLVADGLTNKEVATELYLSAKTVEYHLTRVYRKLNIRTRSELARALDEL